MFYISLPSSLKEGNKSTWDGALTQLYQRIPDSLQGEDQDAYPQ